MRSLAPIFGLLARVAAALLLFASCRSQGQVYKSIEHDPSYLIAAPPSSVFWGAQPGDANFSNAVFLVNGVRAVLIQGTNGIVVTTNTSGVVTSYAVSLGQMGPLSVGDTNLASAGGTSLFLGWVSASNHLAWIPAGIGNVSLTNFAPSQFQTNGGVVLITNVNVGLLSGGTNYSQVVVTNLSNGGATTNTYTNGVLASVVGAPSQTVALGVISQGSAGFGQALLWNGATWVPTTIVSLTNFPPSQFSTNNGLIQVTNIAGAKSSLVNALLGTDGGGNIVNATNINADQITVPYLVVGQSITPLNATPNRHAMIGADDTLTNAVASGAVPINADGSATTPSQVQALFPGLVVTNGETQVITVSNQWQVDAAHQFVASNLTASRVLLSRADNGITNSGVSGAIPINADGSATTFPQIQTLANGVIMTNGGVTAVTYSNTVTVDAGHYLSGSVQVRTNSNVWQTANYNVGVNDNYVLLAANLSATLPDPTASGVPGRQYWIQCTGSGTNAILQHAAETLNGNMGTGLTKVTNTAAGKGTLIWSNGTNWWYLQL